MRAWTCAAPSLAAAAREIRVCQGVPSLLGIRIAGGGKVQNQESCQRRGFDGRLVVMTGSQGKGIANDLLALASCLEPNRLGVSDQASSRNSGGGWAGQAPMEASGGADSTDDEDEKQHFHCQHPLGPGMAVLKLWWTAGSLPREPASVCWHLAHSQFPAGRNGDGSGKEGSKWEETPAANSVALNFMLLPCRRPSRDICTTRAANASCHGCCPDSGAVQWCQAKPRPARATASSASPRCQPRRSRQLPIANCQSLRQHHHHHHHHPIATTRAEAT